jgi:transcriptional regulator with XRE-family HTH domain
VHDAADDEWLEHIGWVPTDDRPQTADGPGLVRRLRRLADLSQRDAARVLQVSQSTVARWETGNGSPSLVQLQELADLGGVRVVLRDGRGREHPPMRDEVAHDRAGRHYPAHLDPHESGWYTPPGSEQDGRWARLWHEARLAAVPRVRFTRSRPWRDIARRVHGLDEDHPSPGRLVADVEQRTGEMGGPPPTPPD